MVFCLRGYQIFLDFLSKEDVECCPILCVHFHHDEKSYIDRPYKHTQGKFTMYRILKSIV